MKTEMRFAILLLITVCAVAKSPMLEFEAAAIAPAPTQELGFTIRGGPGSNDPEMFDCAQCVPGILLRNAFGVQYYQINGPEWLAKGPLHLTARIPPKTSRADFQIMLQNLLIDRFKLAYHREYKDMAVLDMIVGKGGAKLKDTVAPDHEGPLTMPEARTDKNGYPNMPKGCHGCMMVIDGKGRFSSEQVSMPELAQILSLRLNKLVFDKTGLTGRYDVDVLFSRPDGSPGSADLGLPLPESIEQQLGLKFESRKEPVEMIVIDHMEKTPTAN